MNETIDYETINSLVLVRSSTDDQYYSICCANKNNKVKELCRLYHNSIVDLFGYKFYNMIKNMNPGSHIAIHLKAQIPNSIKE